MNLSQYTPYLLGGGVLIVVFLLLRSGGGGGESSGATPPPTYTAIQPGPTDNSYSIAKLQDNFARTQLSAGLFQTLLQRDFAMQQLAAQERIYKAQFDAQVAAAQQTQQSTANKAALNFSTTGGMRG